MEEDYDGPSELSKKLRPSSKISDYYNALAEFFKAGAKWQRQQMLKDAVEGNIHLVGFNNAIFIKEPKAEILDHYNVGDKVRIVVLKSEEEG